MRNPFPGALFTVLVCAHVRADAGPQPSEVEVTREAGAETCPDADALWRRVEAVRGRDEAGPRPSAYRVAFSRAGDDFSAAIHTGEDGENVRVLSAHGEQCAAL